MPLKNADVEIDEGAISETALILGIEITSDDPDEMVEELREAFALRLESIPKDLWVRCTVCDEVTDPDPAIKCCPFCGDEGEDVEPAEPETIDTEDDLAPLDGADYDNSPDPEEAEPVDLSEGETIGFAQTGPVADSEDEKGAVKPAKKKGKAKASEKKKPSEGKVKGKVKGKAKPSDKPPVSKPKASKKKGPKKDAQNEALIIPEEKKAEMLVELASEKAKIVQGQKNMLTSGYDLGESLRKVYTAELWRAEGHKDFREFCVSLNISHTLAYNLMKIVNQFDRETFMEVGQKKLSLIARADPEDRPALLEEAKGGKSARQIESTVKEKKKSKGKEKPAKENSASGSASVGRPKIEDQTITLLSKVGGAATTFPFRSSKTYEEVAEWSPDTYSEIPISDRVVQYIVIKADKTGKPVGINVAFRKVPDDVSKSSS